jgi:multicomponent Na+:H+ antiporter subunit G
MITLIGLCALMLGIAITAAGVVGIYRFPDVYARLNALAKVTTMGAILVHLSSGALLPPGQGGKAVLTAFILLLTTPVITQAIAFLSHQLGLPHRLQRDELASDQANLET